MGGHAEAKEETGFTAEGQAHGRSPGREVTSFHTLSSSLPPLAWQGVNPERATFHQALANSTQARVTEPRLSLTPFSYYAQSTDRETEAQRS